jgi:hypothetical protein
MIPNENLEVAYAPETGKGGRDMGEYYNFDYRTLPESWQDILGTSTLGTPFFNRSEQGEFGQSFNLDIMLFGGQHDFSYDEPRKDVFGKYQQRGVWWDRALELAGYKKDKDNYYGYAITPAIEREALKLWHEEKKIRGRDILSGDAKPHRSYPEMVGGIGGAAMADARVFNEEYIDPITTKINEALDFEMEIEPFVDVATISAALIGKAFNPDEFKGDPIVIAEEMQELYKNTPVGERLPRAIELVGAGTEAAGVMTEGIIESFNFDNNVEEGIKFWTSDLLKETVQDDWVPILDLNGNQVVDSWGNPEYSYRPSMTLLDAVSLAPTVGAGVGVAKKGRKVYKKGKRAVFGKADDVPYDWKKKKIFEGEIPTIDLHKPVGQSIGKSKITLTYGDLETLTYGTAAIGAVPEAINLLGYMISEDDNAISPQLSFERNFDLVADRYGWDPNSDDVLALKNILYTSGAPRLLPKSQDPMSKTNYMKGANTRARWQSGLLPGMPSTIYYYENVHPEGKITHKKNRQGTTFDFTTEALHQLQGIDPGDFIINLANRAPQFSSFLHPNLADIWMGPQGKGILDLSEQYERHKLYLKPGDFEYVHEIGDPIMQNLIQMTKDSIITQDGFDYTTDNKYVDQLRYVLSHPTDKVDQIIEDNSEYHWMK